MSEVPPLIDPTGDPTVIIECDCGPDAERHVVGVFKRPIGWERWGVYRSGRDKPSTAALVGDRGLVNARDLRDSRERVTIVCKRSSQSEVFRAERLDTVLTTLHGAGVERVLLRSLAARMKGSKPL